MRAPPQSSFVWMSIEFPASFSTQTHFIVGIALLVFESIPAALPAIYVDQGHTVDRRAVAVRKLCQDL
jgi:hypothetical protein